MVDGKEVVGNNYIMKIRIIMMLVVVVGCGDYHNLLNSEEELSLIQKMLDLPDLIEMMSLKIEPHKLPHYTLELAGKLHLFYETCRIITSIEKDIPLMKSRLKLTNACAIVLKKCLQLMEMKAPNKM